jgi:hypothetical protein
MKKFPSSFSVPYNQKQFAKNADGTYLGYKVMQLKNGKLVSSANNRISFYATVGLSIKMPGNGVYLSNRPQYVLDHYGDLSEHEVLLTLKFNYKDIVKNKLQFYDKDPEIGLSTVLIVHIASVLKID